MNRLALILVVALMHLCWMPLTDAAAPEQQPNVVLILVDDLGWMDLSCQGSDYFRTPNIDALANDGIRFTDAYAACAVCSPTRSAIMTGRYPARVGVTDWIRARFQRGGIGTPSENPTEFVGGPKQKLLCPPNPYWMEHEEVTIAELLAPLGYASCHVGKWHLGDPEWYPTHQGFDVNVAGCDLGQPPSYFDPYTHERYHFDGQLEPRKEGEFLTHREADEAAEFIREHKDEPFFLNYCPYAVHTPIQAIEEVAKTYEREGKSAVNAKYAALVESVDDAVGTIVGELEKLGLTDRTLVIFTSDNGGLIGPTNNAPLRSGKGYAYEGGIRVPLIMKWPGVIPAQTTSDEPVMSIDLLPTIAAATGATLPSDRTIDGESLLSLVQSGGEEGLEERVLTWHFPHYRHAPGPYSIIRSGDWKLIRWDEGPVELYNLDEDLGETKNLSDKLPELRVELNAKLDAELKAQGAKIPVPNPNYR
ncbi:sulfatase [Thalassoglobus sp. JC818]|uniref:sulfatase n=1 Tax=Thalassoglobus sp. JC818 TaxID=3232136 RepID=UPI00345A63EF